MTHIGKSADNKERTLKCLNNIENASKHLMGVISDILDMSKIEANKLELSPEDFAFEEMLNRVINVVNFRMDEKHQSLSVDIDGGIPKSLYGDDHRLAQVITNLLSNAVKFTPDDGSITLNARLLEEAEGVCTIQFTVKDTGIGMNSEQKATVFDTFSQAELGTTRKYGGTGLGLSISKSIVEMMGGKIWVESTPGSGSSFIFTVEMTRSKANITGTGRFRTDGREVSDLEGILDGYRILLVDDVEINREIVTALLEETRVDIYCAENGVDAVDMFRQSPQDYDLIFMDVQMPEMDGYEATRTIRALDVPNAKSVPIIAMTANVFREDVEKCLEAGMNGHIGKPINMDELLDKLCAYVKNESAIV